MAEDDEAVRGITVLALTRAGYQVVAAEGGRTAMELARRHAGPIQLTITDAVMSGMSG